MSKRIFTEELFPKEENQEVIELFLERRNKRYVNIGLVIVYLALLITSLFIL